MQLILENINIDLILTNRDELHSELCGQLSLSDLNKVGAGWWWQQYAGRNIQPRTRKEHIDRHKKNGDFNNGQSAEKKQSS